jgi:hypothetical protein
LQLFPLGGLTFFRAKKKTQREILELGLKSQKEEAVSKFEKASEERLIQAAQRDEEVSQISDKGIREELVEDLSTSRAEGTRSNKLSISKPENLKELYDEMSHEGKDLYSESLNIRLLH